MHMLTTDFSQIHLPHRQPQDPEIFPVHVDHQGFCLDEAEELVFDRPF